MQYYHNKKISSAMDFSMCTNYANHENNHKNNMNNEMIFKQTPLNQVALFLFFFFLIIHEEEEMQKLQL